MTMPSSDRLIGQELKAHCGKCKTETLHTITTVKNGKVSRIMCSACNSYHIYRGNDAPTSSRKSAAKSPKRTVRRRKKNWDTMVAEVEENEVKEYDFSKDFRSAKAVNHKSFGVGVITKIVNNTRMEVLFKDGTRMLGQNIDLADLESMMS